MKCTIRIMLAMGFCASYVHAMEQEMMPPEPPKISSDVQQVLTRLRDAHTSNNDTLRTQYAKEIAKLCVSHASLASLRENPDNHWAVKNIALFPDTLKKIVYPYMPKVFAQRYRSDTLDEKEPIYDARFLCDDQKIFVEYHKFLRDSAQTTIYGQFLNAHTGKIVHTIRAEDNMYLNKFSATGRNMAFASLGSTQVKILDVPAGRITHTIACGSDTVEDMKFAAQENIFACTAGKQVKIIDLENKRPTYSITHDDNVKNIAFASDSNTMASTSLSAAKITSVKDGVLLHAIAYNTQCYRFAWFSPDTKNVVFASRDGSALLVQWDGTAWKQHKIALGKPGEQAVFSSDGSNVAIVGNTWSKDEENSVIKIVDIPSGNIVQTISYPCIVYNVAFIAQGQKIYSNSCGGTRISDVKTGDLELAKPHPFLVYSALSPDETKLAIASGKRSIFREPSDPDPRIEVIDKQNKMVHTLKDYKKGINSLNFSPEGNILLITAEDGASDIFDAESVSYILRTKNEKGYDQGQGFSADGNRALLKGWRNIAIIESASKTFEQALLVQLLKWCRANNQEAPHAWVRNILNTYQDRTIINKVIAENTNNCTIL